MVTHLGLALAAFIIILAPSSVHASPLTSTQVRGSPIFDGLDGALREASIVARVRLVSRMPVGTRPSPEGTWRPVLGEEPSCGYLYKAEVVEAFKGGSQSFEFFSANDDDFSGFDHDYFVIVFMRKSDHRLLNLDDTKLIFGEDEGREINCLISQRYYVGRLIQSMFTFDDLASSQLGGEWLAPPNRDAVGWCFYWEDIAKPGEARVFSDRKVLANRNSYGLRSWEKFREAMSEFLAPVPTGGANYPARSWSVMEKVIRENLGDGPYLAC